MYFPKRMTENHELYSKFRAIMPDRTKNSKQKEKRTFIGCIMKCLMRRVANKVVIDLSKLRFEWGHRHFKIK